MHIAFQQPSFVQRLAWQVTAPSAPASNPPASKPENPPVSKVPGSDVGQRFLKRVEKATHKVIAGFPLTLKRALADYGFEVRVARQPQDGIQSLAEVVSPGMVLQEELAVREKPDFVIKLAEAMANLPAETPPDKQMQCAVDKVLLDRYRPQLQANPAYFSETTSQIRLSQEIIGPYRAAWRPITQSVHRLATVIRHEAGHFLDIAVGRAKTGKRFSDDLSFRATVMHDLNEAKSRPELLAKTGRNALGSDITHYFPIYGDSALFAEAFAEVTAAMFGGGALAPAVVKKLFGNTIAYLNTEVFKKL